MASLPDLKQENQYVHDTLISWIRDLVQKYNIDGLRIDTIPEVFKSFWSDFSAAAGVFTIGEVFDGRLGYVADYQNHIDATLHYPLYFEMKNVFLYKKGMNTLESFYQSLSIFKDQSVLGVFTDNHDNPRFLSIKNDYVLYKSFLTFNFGASTKFLNLFLFNNNFIKLVFQLSIMEVSKDLMEVRILTIEKHYGTISTLSMSFLDSSK